MINSHNIRMARRLGVFKTPHQINSYPAKSVSFSIILVWLTILSSCTLCHAIEASWYSTESLHKEGTFERSHGLMANGQVFNDKALTCATRLYPLGTMLLITNKLNNKSVMVKVTDRIGKRLAKTRIDLSKEAFSRIADIKTGIIPIKVKKINIEVI